jgi:hypothetical protein
VEVDQRLTTCLTAAEGSTSAPLTPRALSSRNANFVYPYAT